LGRTLFDLRRLAEADDQTARALEANPQSFSLKQIRAQILFEQGQFAESAELYRWCLTRKPDDASLERRAKAAIDAALRITGNSVDTSVR
jgi:predicted Zn-dependent protease